MRRIISTRHDSKRVGSLPEGCKLCVRGLKSVLFTTGVCGRSCFFCPLSEKRKGKSGSWINEKKIKSEKDIVSEIFLCGSKGAGITGGEPLHDSKSVERVAGLIRLMKKSFGKSFHVHVYTSREDLTAEEVGVLASVGLDEIRFHPVTGKRDCVLPALDCGMDVGVEVPVIPGEFRRLCSLVNFLEDQGVKFLNLNELEFSDTNAERMREKGFELNEDGFSVSGSAELADKVLSYAARNTKNLSVHYCSSSTKQNYQYRNRLARRAKNVRKSFETVTGAGLLRKGAVTLKARSEADALARTLGLGAGSFAFRQDKSRVELSVPMARHAARKGFEAAIILELPTADGFDVEISPLDRRGREKSAF